MTLLHCMVCGGEAMKRRAERDKETRNRAKKFEALQTAKKKKGPNTQ
jgi:hypothetical protein